ncbi:unnamed protein product (macronuclear) [Paramecium tetraurelia]|uniref:Protein kinase domain-containing protein n=1 Tax=Paramecium tetraurelia TaxID=5888 RepID=A0CWU7_PARTE|nr:uncharacterized protein GSPATT00001467001 [Paramecium tetraurelia]CAK75264.1 unnamed protein product [Paramecium tetraurelia]|eukprot:XP_001442661.1 hypothetical protein (macronuclear) [Paramecium tetraurelia strain d4-2]
MQINCQQKDQQILLFTVFRKHFFRDQSYYLKLSKKQILMSQECQFVKTKYVLDLSPDTQFEWIVRNQQLVGFLFPYQNKMKEFFGDSHNLTELKQILGKQILFKSLTIHYKLVRYLDSGAFGQISLQQNYINGQLIAIKTLINTNKSAQYLIENEMKILRALNHPNILSIQEVFLTNLTYSIITDYIEGKNLRKLILENSELQELTILQIAQVKILKLFFQQLFEGLSYIHKMGIIHRDIKPANLMLSKNGMLKIIDFGLSCYIGNQFQENPKCGTPGFCAPEILQNIDNNVAYDYKVDVFSAGCVLYKLLTFKGLFDASTSAEVLKKNKNCLFIIKEQGRLFDLVKTMLKQNPLERLSSEQALQLIKSMIEDDTLDVNIWYRLQLNSNQSTQSNIILTPKQSAQSKSLQKFQSTPNYSRRSFFSSSLKTYR